MAKNNLINTYNIFNCIVMSAKKMVHMLKLKYDNYNPTCLQEVSFMSYSVTMFFPCTLLDLKAMAKYRNRSSIEKIEAKTEILQNFLKIYQKILFENLY